MSREWSTSWTMLLTPITLAASAVGRLGGEFCHLPSVATSPPSATSFVRHPGLWIEPTYHSGIHYHSLCSRINALCPIVKIVYPCFAGILRHLPFKSPTRSIRRSARDSFIPPPYIATGHGLHTRSMKVISCRGPNGSLQDKRRTWYSY